MKFLLDLVTQLKTDCAWLHTLYHIYPTCERQLFTNVVMLLQAD